MSLYDRVYELSKKRDISLVSLADELHLSRHAFYKWKTSSPKSETLEAVADYFGVTTDYLLGRTDEPYSNQSEADRNKTIQEALDSVMSYDGKSLTENDREVLKRITEAYLDGKL